LNFEIKGLGMVKFIIFSILIYIIFRFTRGLFKGIFVITQIQKQRQEGGSRTENPFIYRSSGREKDISDRARILEEDKNEGESQKLSDFKN
jgi:hypothetical protein